MAIRNLVAIVRRLPCLALMATALACAMPFVSTTVSSFRAPDLLIRGQRLAVAAADQTKEQSLEFRFYRTKLEERFRAQGFEITSASEADYVALVSYGIDNGQKAIVSTPIIGQIGGGTTYTSGTVHDRSGTSTFSGYTYTMPSYGVVGTATSSVMRYTRAIAIDILDVRNVRRGQPERALELRANSVGSCPMISAVFDKMLDAIFQDFPGENGRSETIRIPGKTDC